MKKLWNQNRVLFMLIIILIVCFLAIVCVALTFFYSKNVGKYGARLDDIAKYAFTNDMKSNYKEKLLENEAVKKVDFNIIGRVVYIHIDFDDKIDLVDAKEIVTESLSLFEKDILSYYDFDFVLQNSEFTTLGSKNSIVEHISWGNQRVVEEESTDEES